MKNSSQGFTIVEVMVAAIALAGLSLLIASMMSNTQKGTKQAQVASTGLDLKSRVKGLINSPSAWATSIERQGGGGQPLECLALKSAGDCRPVTGGPVDIYEAGAATPLVKSSSPTAGFTSGGQPCDAYSTNGNDACPFKVKVEWKPLCAPATPTSPTCILPQVEFSMEISYTAKSQAAQVPFNRANYSSTFIQGASMDSLESFCRNMGGSWDPTSEFCDIGGLACGAIGGVWDLDTRKCVLAQLSTGCSDGLLRGISFTADGPVPDCAADDIGEVTPVRVTNGWNVAALKNIDQDMVIGCAVTPGTNRWEASLPCNQDKVAGATGTCYYRNPNASTTGSGWYRVGSGFCRGGIYVPESYNTPPGVVTKKDKDY